MRAGNCKPPCRWLYPRDTGRRNRPNFSRILANSTRRRGRVKGEKGRVMKEALEIMQAEFEATRLEVVLVPARYEVNVGACVRVAISSNCDWYRRLCLRYGSNRQRRNLAPDTRIKRANIARVLQRLIDRGESRSKYVEDLLQMARSYARKMERAPF